MCYPFPRVFSAPQLDVNSGTPLYRQLFESLRQSIDSGDLEKGSKLPATRELAGLLGLNRATIAAAYSLLESDGYISGHVGRGSFVTGGARRTLDWNALLAEQVLSAPAQAPPEAISFETSRPSERLFPMDAFRETCREVLDSPGAASILQLGSPLGFGPLRQHLMDAARAEGVLGSGDDLIVTSGCQQGLDLLQRVLIRPGDRVALEDPVYPGIRNLFQISGAQVTGIPVGPVGFDLAALERILDRDETRLLVVTPNFQNPTGATMPSHERTALLQLAHAAGVVVVENDIYGELRYHGDPEPPLKRLDTSGSTVLLRSFSKIAFPGLRVGWVIGPAPLIARMAEVKQLSDLHTDQLSQAILLRFRESGRLAAHLRRMLEAGVKRLHAVLDACERHLPEGSTFSRPQGGMNLWVRLPAPLDAGELLGRAQREGVTYLPGKFFTVSRPDPGGFRLSFAGLPPEQIRRGLSLLGEVFSAELEGMRTRRSAAPAPALV